jgi:hypothetical protein
MFFLLLWHYLQKNRQRSSSPLFWESSVRAPNTAPPLPAAPPQYCWPWHVRSCEYYCRLFPAGVSHFGQECRSTLCHRPAFQRRSVRPTASVTNSSNSGGTGCFFSCLTDIALLSFIKFPAGYLRWDPVRLLSSTVRTPRDATRWTTQSWQILGRRLGAVMIGEAGGKITGGGGGGMGEAGGVTRRSTTQWRCLGCVDKAPRIHSFGTELRFSLTSRSYLLPGKALLLVVAFRPRSSLCGGGSGGLCGRHM